MWTTRLPSEWRESADSPLSANTASSTNSNGNSTHERSWPAHLGHGLPKTHIQRALPGIDRQNPPWRYLRVGVRLPDFSWARGDSSHQGTASSGEEFTWTNGRARTRAGSRPGGSAGGVC